MPLGFDFPIEKLKDYQGLNPKPADFDAFWAAGLTEMMETDRECSGLCKILKAERDKKRGACAVEFSWLFRGIRLLDFLFALCCGRLCRGCA